MTELQVKIARIRQLDKDLIPEAIEDMQRLLSIATACTTKSGKNGQAQSGQPGTGTGDVSRL